MRLRTVILTGLTVASFFVGAGQAYALNMLVALGNPYVQFIQMADGTWQVVEIARPEPVEVTEITDLEPAAGD